ncbi:MAG: leucine-rich repeat domain-containing protein [Clostridiales bacterium]|nr:leucine-rich repeat domain-containing protein [Clostridiales bacterium]
MGLAKIGKWAFSGCKKLELLDLPAKVSKVGEEAFADSGIRTLVIRNKNLSLDGTNCLKHCGNCLIYAPKESRASIYNNIISMPLELLSK